MSRKRVFTAYYNPETGELSEIDFSDTFCAESALLQADVLQDILGSISSEYTEAIEEWADSMVKE